MPSYAVIKLKLRAEIGPEGSVWKFPDVVQWVATFAMNSIPVSSIMVALGHNVADDKVATIHDAITDITVNKVAKIYLTGTVTDQEEVVPGLPSGKELLVFEGKVVGTGFRRTENGAHFTIHLLHWVGDINYASAISASSHPGNPADLTYPAVYRALGPAIGDPAGGGDADASWVPMVSKDLVNVENLEDIWGKIPQSDIQHQ